VADYIGKKLTDKDPNKLFPEDIIGADISDWKGEVKSFNGQEFFYEPVFDRLSDLSKSIKAASLTLTIFCVFCICQVSSIQDLDLLGIFSTTELPIISLKVSVRQFFKIAPIALLILSYYQHLHLAKFWKEISCLPLIFQDGKAIHEKVALGAPYYLLLSFSPYLKTYRDSVSSFGALIYYAQLYLLAPFTLAILIYRFLPKHDLANSLWILIPYLLLMMIWSFCDNILHKSLGYLTVRAAHTFPFSYFFYIVLILSAAGLVFCFSFLDTPIYPDVCSVLFVFLVTLACLALSKLLLVITSEKKPLLVIYLFLKAMLSLGTAKKEAQVLEKKLKNVDNKVAIDPLIASWKNFKTGLNEAENNLLLLSRPLLIIVIVLIVYFLVLGGSSFWASHFNTIISSISGLKIPSGTHLSSPPPLYFERMHNIDSQKNLSQKDKYDQKKSLYKQVIPFGEYGQKGLDLNLLSAKFTFLVRAQLEAASLKKANLRGADLSWAWLHLADLENAELNETTLFGTNFEDANLSKANFEDAKLFAAIFTNANLADAKNLTWTQLRNTTLIDKSNEYVEKNKSYKYLCGAKLPEYLIKNKEPWYRELERKWQKDLKGKCDS
jgi:hypothetical protein